MVCQASATEHAIVKRSPTLARWSPLFVKRYIPPKANAMPIMLLRLMRRLKPKKRKTGIRTMLLLVMSEELAASVKRSPSVWKMNTAERSVPSIIDDRIVARVARAICFGKSASMTSAASVKRTKIKYVPSNSMTVHLIRRKESPHTAVMNNKPDSASA